MDDSACLKRCIEPSTGTLLIRLKMVMYIICLLVGEDRLKIIYQALYTIHTKQSVMLFVMSWSISNSTQKLIQGLYDGATRVS